jgi:signal transduction histidine kinase
MQRSFVSNASHELRTPLTSITGQLEVSLMKPRTQKEYEDILESVLEDIKNLNALSNGLLNLAKASSDISAIALRSLRFDEILWETKDELVKRNKNWKIFIDFNDTINEEKELTVLGNEQLIKTVVINLIDNACKFSPDHSAYVSLSSENDFLITQIKDNGPGIAPTDMKNIFHPFFRADNVRQIPGNGLGLSLAKKIVEIHKGTFTINSMINKGTTIEFSIPNSV